MRIVYREHRYIIKNDSGTITLQGKGNTLKLKAVLARLCSPIMYPLDKLSSEIFSKILIERLL